MKTNLFKKVMWMIFPLLTLFSTTIRAVDYEEVATFESATVVTASSYTTYENTNWYLSKGGNNVSGGFNSSNQTTIGNAFGTTATTTHKGFYIRSKTKLDNVSKITFVHTAGSNNGNTHLYLAYSTNGSTWNAVTLTTGSQGMAAGTANTTYTMAFAEIASAYYVIIVSRQNTTSGAFRLDNITATFYAESSSCEKIDAPTVTATPGNERIDLSWSDQTGASSYTVTKTPSGGTIGTPSKSGSTWSCAITGLTNGTAYTWSVEPVGDGTTYCASGNTAASASATPNIYYTVTWMNNGSSYTTTSVVNGQKPTFPSDPSSCDDESTTFYGWSTAEWTGKLDDVSAKTIYTSAASMPNVSGAVTYYAVFCKGGANGSISISSSDLKSGLSGSYGSGSFTKNIGGTNYTFNTYACVQNSTFQMRAADAYIQIPTLPGPITNISSSSCNNAGTGNYNGTLRLKSAQAAGSSTDYDISTKSVNATSFSWDITGSYTSGYITTSAGLRLSNLTISYGTPGSKYLTNCCTDWSTPTVTYATPLAINASEAVTISSGTTHGAVTYESSDEDVLTVDADGTIHAVGAGTAHITATWAGDATYCEKSANSNDVTVSGIQVTGTTPVNFGQVYQNAAVANKTIYVTGLGLASPITPSLPVGSPFSFSPASLAKDCSGATLTISASTATLGTYNQTLTLTSGAFSATVTVKMEVIAKPTATFTDALHELTTDKNGASLNSFNLEAAQGTPVVFPTLANQTKSAGTCEGEYYIFVGWTEGDNNTDPQDHLVTSHTLANGDAKHYYAVWADASGSATYTKLTSSTFKTTPTKYVLGGEYNGTKYFLYTYSSTDADLSWGECSSSEAPIQFTLSGEAGTLVAQDASGNYLAESSAKKKFRMSSTSATVQLQDDGTIKTESFYLRYNHNSGSGGLRYYETDSSEPAYFYEVSAAGTVHYRTSCCANKVNAPVVTATAVTSTSITLTWPSDVKATGWQIEWNGAGGWVTPSGSCTHTVSGLTPNTTYTWRVRATYEDPVCGADVRSGSTTTNQVYHVTYAKGSGTGTCTATGSTTDETGYEAGATVTLQANEFLLSGHTFAGWTEDDEDITISSNQFTMPDHDVVITASWTAKVDKYFDRMHDQTDASHGGVAETEGTNEGKYYILKEGCSYSVPTAVDSKTGDACQTSHYKLRGWIAASYVNSKGEITDESKIFSPGTTKTAGGYTYYAVWAEVVE